MSVNIKINEVLKEKNKTKYWLCNNTGITYANISRMCSGKTTSISFNSLNKICDALNCEPGDIIKKE